MTLILLLIAISAGTAVVFTVRAFLTPRVEAAERIGRIRAYGFDATNGDGAIATADERTPALHSLGAYVLERTHLSEAEIRRELVAAGLYDISPIGFIGVRVLAGIVLPFVLALVGLSAGANAFIVFVLIVWGAASGFMLPMTIVRRRAAKRLAEIDYALPELVDLLVVSVEAGLGFSGAVRLAAERQRGPLGVELRLALQEQSMGMSMNDALNSMLTRTDTPAMRSFVRSILQGEALGVSIGQIMRSLASEMRKRRRTAAEERAHKAPIKLLFPLVFLIFPPVFVVVLYPALHNFLQALG